MRDIKKITFLSAILFFCTRSSDLNNAGFRLLEVGKLASDGKQTEIEEWFNKQVNPSELGLAINAASRKGHLGIVKFLVGKGADKTDKQLALNEACKNKHKEVAQYLLDQEPRLKVTQKECASLNLTFNQPPPSEGDTARFNLFYEAITTNDYQLLNMLIEKVDLSLQGPDGLTALQKAVLLDNFQLVKILLNYKAPINQQNKAGNTALHLACREGNLALITFLINAGADYKIKNNFGKRPIDNYSFSTFTITEKEFLTSIYELIKEKEKDKSFLNDLQKRISQIEEEL